MTLAKKIEQLFKTRCAEFKEKYKLNFGVYYTPEFPWGLSQRCEMKKPAKRRTQERRAKLIIKQENQYVY